MDTPAFHDVLAALNVWSGQSLVNWAGDLTSATQTTLDPLFTSTPVLGAHATIESALVHWGVAAMMAAMVAIRVLPRVLADR
jgi:hypothetical protein